MTRTRWKAGGAAALSALFFAIPLNAVSLTGCSSQNTGFGPSSSSIYMSNGNCHDSCQGFAFAITQYQNCWCSNVAPGSTSSVGSCNQQCPGYPSENCGNKDQGLFGYIALGPAPQATLGASGGGSGGGGSSNSVPASSKAPSSQQQPTIVATTSVAVVSTQVVSC